MNDTKKPLFVAITGGRGMIGRALQRALDAEGIPYRTLGRSAVEWDASRHLVGSTTDPEMVARLMEGATVLFHLARTTHEIEDMCVYDYPAMMHLLPRALKEDMEVHFTSSQMVHDGAR
ncbi:MAG: NAD-dependent epimerase/dehydratase family protein, partial [Chthoniobacterales bacterium]